MRIICELIRKTKKKNKIIYNRQILEKFTDMSAAFRRNKKKLECLTCNKKFASKRALYYHKKIHEKIFQCNVCLKSCPSKAHLDIHSRTHTGEKPYVCSTCDRRFARKYHLQNHVATHSEERKFKCMVCPDNRSFKTKRELTQHMKYHYEPTFSCSKCGKKFHHSGDLNKHVKRNIC